MNNKKKPKVRITNFTGISNDTKIFVGDTQIPGVTSIIFGEIKKDCFITAKVEMEINAVDILLNACDFVFVGLDGEPAQFNKNNDNSENDNKK